MHDNGLTDLELPADAADLTRELALQVFEHPEFLYEAYAKVHRARLAAPPAPAAQHTQHTPAAARVLEKAQAHV